MSKVSIKVDLEEIKRAISKLTDDEREALFLEPNPAWGRDTLYRKWRKRPSKTSERVRL